MFVKTQAFSCFDSGDVTSREDILKLKINREGEQDGGKMHELLQMRLGKIIYWLILDFKIIPLLCSVEFIYHQ